MLCSHPKDQGDSSQAPTLLVITAEHTATADNFRSLQVVPLTPTWESSREQQSEARLLWQPYHSAPDPGRQQGQVSRWESPTLQQGISLLLPLPTFPWCFCMAQIYQLKCFTGLSTHTPITYKNIESVLLLHIWGSGAGAFLWHQKL